MKYRIWHKSTQKFVKSRVDDYGNETNYFIYPDSDGILLCEDIYGGTLVISDHEDYILSYSSGLTDSKEKEIYDGDILDIDFNGYGRFEMIVKYGEHTLTEHPHFVNCLGWYLQTGNHILSLLNSMTDFVGVPHRIRIIGNIYQNNP